MSSMKPLEATGMMQEAVGEVEVSIVKNEHSEKTGS